MKTRLVLGVILVSILFLTFSFSSCNANPIAPHVVLLEPNEETTITINLDSSFKLAGSFYIVNETEPGVVFTITAPNGATIVSRGELVGEVRGFEVLTQEPGNYTLHFKNAREPSTPQTVDLAYTVTGPYFYGVLVDFILAATAIVLLVASLIVLFVFLERKGHRKATVWKQRDLPLSCLCLKFLMGSKQVRGPIDCLENLRQQYQSMTVNNKQ